jgi:DNA adenine methylase
MKPIIKWAGGKRELAPIIKEMMPTIYNRYYEPFLGGAAVLLDLNPKEAYVNDINSELINMYIQVREDVEGVIKYLGSLDWTHEQSVDSKEVYYAIRGLFNNHRGEKTLEQAARFIYLNKHCFNGLYRVNSKGEFNVPFNGKLTGRSFDAEHLREAAKQLKDVVFSNTDFENFLITAGENDFCFIDSPYAPLTATSFTDYTKEGFSYEDHIRLATTFDELSDRGVYCMLTNHDTPLIRELYKDYNIRVVDVRRSINRNGDNRKGKEVIITNF